MLFLKISWELKLDVKFTRENNDCQAQLEMHNKLKQLQYTNIQIIQSKIFLYRNDNNSAKYFSVL